MSELENIEADIQDYNSEIETLARRMAEAYIQAKKAEIGIGSSIRHARNGREELLRTAPDSISWHELGYAEESSPGTSVEIWTHIKQAARDELENGHRAADIVAGVLSPWVRAQFLALRESFIADWQPKGSVEMRLIDQMAQIYTQYEFWIQMAVQRSAVECQLQTDRIKKRGKWISSTIDGNAEMEQAATMADRFNRLFLRTVRALRDLRRYSPPVIVQNAGQVNVGGQQVNITQAKNVPEPQNSTSVINISPDNASDTNENQARLLQSSSATSFSSVEQVRSDKSSAASNIRKKGRVAKKNIE